MEKKNKRGRAKMGGMNGRKIDERAGMRWEWMSKIEVEGKRQGDLCRMSTLLFFLVSPDSPVSPKVECRKFKLWG